MKTNKLLTFSILLLTGLLTTTSCGYYYDPSMIPPIDSNSESNESIESNESESSSSEEESNGNNNESQDVNNRHLIGFEAIDNHLYSIGDVYQDKYQNYINLTAVYKDGTKEEYKGDIDSFIFDEINIRPLGQNKTVKYIASEKITYPGVYIVSAVINTKYFIDYTFEVLEGLSDPNLSVTNFNVNLKNKTFSNKEVVMDTLDATIDLMFSNGGSETISYNKDTKALYPQIEASLYIGEDYSSNLILNRLESENTYTLKINLKDEYNPHNLNSFIKTFFIPKGYYKLDAPSFVTSDFNKDVISATGEANILVVPIVFTAFNNPLTDEDDELYNELDKHLIHMDEEEALTSFGLIYKFYFDEVEAIIPSIPLYFKQSSNNKFKLGGELAYSNLSNPNLINYDFTSIINDDSKESLYTFLQECLDYSISNTPNFDKTKYDLNNDGNIDIVHFITNIDNLMVANGNAFYPHGGYANRETTNPNSLNVDKYYITTTKDMTDLEAAMDSQSVGVLKAVKDIGLTLGLPDISNFTKNGNDHNYVGHADMMSTSILDLNSFNKFANGWTTPYIVDGESNNVDITIRSFSGSGEFILVPANLSTYNESAYDEYFMIEFFNAEGNNGYFLDIYNLFVPEDGQLLEHDTHGVRIHHVDARLVEKLSNGEYEPSDYDPNRSGTWSLANNNSEIYSDGPNAVYDEWSDYKLITAIQKEGHNTFGTDNTRKFLTPYDLFYEGDQFTFSNYDHFLSKSNIERQYMNNGELFEYTIKIVKLDSDYAVINISK